MSMPVSIRTVTPFFALALVACEVEPADSLSGSRFDADDGTSGDRDFTQREYDETSAFLEGHPELYDWFDLELRGLEASAGATGVGLSLTAGWSWAIRVVDEDQDRIPERFGVLHGLRTGVVVSQWSGFGSPARSRDVLAAGYRSPEDLENETSGRLVIDLHPARTRPVRLSRSDREALSFWETPEQRFGWDEGSWDVLLDFEFEPTGTSLHVLEVDGLGASGELSFRTVGARGRCRYSAPIPAGSELVIQPGGQIAPSLERTGPRRFAVRSASAGAISVLFYYPLYWVLTNLPPEFELPPLPSGFAPLDSESVRGAIIVTNGQGESCASDFELPPPP